MTQPPIERDPTYNIRIVGAPETRVRDLYFALLRLTWPWTLTVIVAGYLALNGIFAAAYLVVGGVEHMRPGSFWDAFFFSVQTMGTIGYGALAPASIGANAVVVLESVVSLLLMAAATGLVFAKISRPNARLVFSRVAVIGPMDGKPTLSFRVGNQRANLIVDAHVRMVMVRTDKTKEGNVFYRTIDMKMSRERMLSLSRSWNAMHVIDDASPLCGETAESLAAKDVEILITVTGTDDIWMQTVHASHRYLHSEVKWNSRLADVLSEDGNDLILDLRRFHDVEPS